MSASWKYRAIATVVKTHGRKGEVVAEPRHGLPLLLEKGARVVVVPPTLKGPRSFVVASCANSDVAQCVSFEGVENLARADELVGRTVLMHVDDLPDNFVLYDVESLIGREVHDVTYGTLGNIVEILRGPANDVWAIEGPRGEVLVPVVEHVVVDVPEKGAIVCAVPKGLVKEADG